MLGTVGVVVADIKTTKETLTFNTTTQSRLRTVIPVVPIPSLVNSSPTSVGIFLCDAVCLPYR